MLTGDWTIYSLWDLESVRRVSNVSVDWTIYSLWDNVQTRLTPVACLVDELSNLPEVSTALSRWWVVRSGRGIERPWWPDCMYTPVLSCNMQRVDVYTNPTPGSCGAVRSRQGNTVPLARWPCLSCMAWRAGWEWRGEGGRQGPWNYIARGIFSLALQVTPVSLSKNFTVDLYRYWI